MTSPKGKLIPIGGSEARSPEDEAAVDTRQPNDFFHDGVLKEVLTEIKGPASRILVIPAASSVPDEMGDMYREAFGMLGCSGVDVLQIHERSKTDRDDHLKRLAQADGVIFTGGDQAVLVEKLTDTVFLKRLTDRYQHENFVIAGTSAGAASMAKLMIKEGDSGESMRKGMVDMQLGLSLLPQVIVDTHFIQRSRLPRLTEALLQNPGLIGLGLSEDTGVVITNGNCLRTIGSGSAFVVETADVTETNYESAGESEPVYLNNLKLHILARGASYRIDKRLFMAPQKLPLANSF